MDADRRKFFILTLAFVRKLTDQDRLFALETWFLLEIGVFLEEVFLEVWLFTMFVR